MKGIMMLFDGSKLFEKVKSFGVLFVFLLFNKETEITLGGRSFKELGL